MVNRSSNNQQQAWQSDDMESMKALVALLPAAALFSGAMLLVLRGRTASSLLQLLGAGFLVVVVLAHVSESLHLRPWMRWGRADGPGHYLDLSSAILGATMFPVGYLLEALNRKRP